MAYFDELSPSSVLSPLLGMDADSFYSSLDSTMVTNDSTAAAMAASSSAMPTSSSLKRGLSSTSSLSTVKDGSARRGSKRRKSRAKPKAPIAQVSANKLNFRDIVHKYTGAPPSCCLQMPGTTENPGGVYDPQHMSSTLHVQTSLTQKDALVAGALLAQSLRTLDTISSYILQSNWSQDTSKETTNTQVTRGDVPASCSNEQVDGACKPVGELENFLLKGDSKLDTFFSLSCLLLNQIASQCGVLSNR